jgi:putative cell wall-binding protein
VIASGENFPDALAANGLAGALNGGLGAPVILTKKGALSSQAKELLKKMSVQTVYIMGGTSAISAETEKEIKDLKIATVRVAGADRQATSVEAFKLIDGNWYKNHGTHSVIIATGANYADALSIAPFAYKTGTPIVLTKADGTLTEEAVKAIKDNDEIYQVIVVGGTAAVSDSVFSALGTYNGNYKDYYNKVYIPVRIAGADRYDTSAKIADWEINYAFDIAGRNTLLWGPAGFSMDEVFVATGENFPDALAGGQLAGGKWYANVDTDAVKRAVFTRVNGERITYANTDLNWNFAAISNQLTSSPILLTKDGNRSADAVISQYLGWNSDKVSVDAFDFMSGLRSFFNMEQTGWYYDFDALYSDGALGFFMNGQIVDGDDTDLIDSAADTRFVEFTDGYRNVQNNFVGYILGGKAAVSKAKAEQLDDTVDASIRKYYDDYADSYDIIEFGGRKYYRSLGYLMNSVWNIKGTVFGVDEFTFFGDSIILPIDKNYGPFEYYYGLVGYDENGNYVFAEFKRNTTGFYEDIYTGYGFNGVVTCDPTGTNWTRNL